MYLAGYDVLGDTWVWGDTLDYAEGFGLGSSTYDQWEDNFVFLGLPSGGMAGLQWMAQPVWMHDGASFAEFEGTLHSIHHDMQSGQFYDFKATDWTAPGCLGEATKATGRLTIGRPAWWPSPQKTAKSTWTWCWRCRGSRAWWLARHATTATPTAFSFGASTTPDKAGSWGRLRTGRGRQRREPSLEANQNLSEFEYNIVDGMLLGLRASLNSTNTSAVMELISVDPATGDITPRLELPNLDSYTPDGTVFDQLNRMYVLHYYAGMGTSPHIMAIDATTWDILADNPLNQNFWSSK